MSHIEIAKALVKENNEDLGDRRRDKEIISQRIKEYTRDIEKYERLLDVKKRALKMAKEDLKTVDERIEELLVDNLALETLIGFLTVDAD